MGGWKHPSHKWNLPPSHLPQNQSNNWAEALKNFECKPINRFNKLFIIFLIIIIIVIIIIISIIIIIIMIIIIIIINTNIVIYEIFGWSSEHPIDQYLYLASAGSEFHMINFISYSPFKINFIQPILIALASLQLLLSSDIRYFVPLKMK